MYKPMLAPQDDPLKRPTFFDDLPWPLLGSYKYDGIRGVPKPAGVLSRTNKPLPSYQLQEEFGMLIEMDGEFGEGDPCTPDFYNRTHSYVMARAKPGDISFYVFDWAEVAVAHKPFFERLEIAEKAVKAVARNDVVFVPHEELNNLDELLAFEAKALELGYEGIMMRTPWGHYKHNRCTWLDEIIYKLKRFQDDEGLIIGFEEQQTNTNKQERDERGYAKRSSSKEGLVGANTLGSFIVDYKGQTIFVAPGVFTHKQRKEIWDHQDLYKFQPLKFRFFGYGVKYLPRFPRAIGFRNKMDM